MISFPLTKLRSSVKTLKLNKKYNNNRGFGNVFRIGNWPESENQCNLSALSEKETDSEEGQYTVVQV